jgi:ankyrin repeat protein
MNTLMMQPTRGDLRQALKNIAKGPDKLDQTYEQAMDRINDQGSRICEIAKGILGWIIHAKRPLSTNELQHALAVRPDTSKLDKDYLPSIQLLLSICAGLVTIDREGGIIRLVHFTTREYFERTWTFWFPNAQKDITNVCVTYLSFDIFEAGFCQSDKEFKTRLQTNVLYDYAARYWGYHAQKAWIDHATTISIKNDLVLDFLKSRAKVSAASQAMMASGSYSGYSQRMPREFTGAHVAVCFGLKEAMVDLLSSGSDLDKVGIDLKDSNGWTPLLWAVQIGHKGIVKLLLETGKVDVDSQNKGGQTPLLCAAKKGHRTIVKRLLKTGKVGINIEDQFGQTPILWAAENGHEIIVKLLLETGKVIIDINDQYGQTPLSLAAENGHEAVVKLLLNTGQVEIDSTDGIYGQTPLSWAVENGHEPVVKLLLETGQVDIYMEDQYKRSPLWWAVYNEDKAVFRLMLEMGQVNVNPKRTDGRTPLLWAAENGHEVVVKLLLKTGQVDIDVKSTDGRTPLLWAAENGDRAIVKLLLKIG